MGIINTIKDIGYWLFDIGIEINGGTNKRIRARAKRFRQKEKQRFLNRTLKKEKSLCSMLGDVVETDEFSTIKARVYCNEFEGKIYITPRGRTFGVIRGSDNPLSNFYQEGISEFIDQKPGRDSYFFFDDNGRLEELYDHIQELDGVEIYQCQWDRSGSNSMKSIEDPLSLFHSLMIDHVYESSSVFREYLVVKRESEPDPSGSIRVTYSLVDIKEDVTYWNMGSETNRYYGISVFTGFKKQDSE